MNFLRKMTLVIAEIILLLAVSTLLITPLFMARVANDVNGIDPTIRITIAVVIDVLLVAAVISQLRAAPRYSGAGLLVQSGDSSTSVTTESVRQNVMKAVAAIADIESVECKTTSKHGEAVLELDVATSKDDINIPKKQREIDRAIKQVVVKQMGVKLNKPPVVSIRLASDKPKPAPVAPAAPKPAAVAPKSAPAPKPVEAPKDEKAATPEAESTK